MLKPDQHLIAEVQKLANGRFSHDAANLVANYVGCLDLLKDAEKEMRKFVALRKMESLQFLPPTV